MSDEPKSCALINKEVALHLGWAQVSCNTSYVPDVWYPLGYEAGRKYGKSSPPNYCGEWHDAGPLYVELLLKFNGVQFTNYGEDGWGCECFEVDDEQGIDVLVIEEGGETVPEAITRVFHAAFAEERE